ncbi:tetratricopeptide repeat protein [Streptomyces sp. NBC_01429]|uniref:tetratricopeptide repeat protein n=1 Tax=Streptomyces sp. NBC_01429 TaxID=2903862 RepID=UPI003FCC68A9
MRESGRDRHPEPDPAPDGVTHGGGTHEAGPAPAPESPAARPEADDAATAGPAPETGPAPEADSAPEAGPAPDPGPAPDLGPEPESAAVVEASAAPLLTGPAGPAGVRPPQPLRTPDPVRPEPDGLFFGRQRELKALHGDIERAGLNTISGRKEPRARVLLIAGRPGSGRTALGRELAGQLAAGYPDGVVRARLTEAGGAPVPTERTAREILGVFGVATPPGAGEDELSEMVREALAVRRVLLLLDDAVDAGQVDPLVPDNPGCLVVAVAQGPLTGIPDVRPCTLGGMDAKAAIELLARFAGSVRITVDPQAAESLAEECGGQPAALVLAGGWLAARPTASVADAAKRLRALPYDAERPVGDRPLARAFQLVYESLPGPAARILRLLALAPAGLADAHTASALAGCSVSAAGVALDDFTARGLLHRADAPTPDPGPLDFRDPDSGAAEPQYVVPGCLVPLLRAVMEREDRPAEVQLARARMLERTVRLLQSCRAVTDPEGSPARLRLAGLPRALRFPHAGSADAWLYSRRPALLASARLAVADGELDTLARRLVAALVRALAAHRGTEAAAPELYGLHQLVLDIAERRELHRERAAALLNIGDLDARTGRTHDALVRYRAALDAGREAGDLYATGRAMESIGGAHQDLRDWQRAADWYGRALSQRLSRGERADEARLYGRLGTVHTYAGRYGEALRNWRAAAAVHRRLQEPAGLARALSEVARVQEYAGRPQESLRTCQEAVEWARQAQDVRLQAALQLRLADTLDRLGDPTAARLHRATSDRLLETEG